MLVLVLALVPVLLVFYVGSDWSLAPAVEKNDLQTGIASCSRCCVLAVVKKRSMKEPQQCEILVDTVGARW